MGWVSNVYFAAFVLSVINLIALSIIVKRQKCFYYVIFFMLIIISSFGYVTMANATQLKVALIGNTLTYFGAAFLPYSFMLCLSELCQILIKKWASLTMFAYNSIVFMLVWTTIIGNKLFYKEVSVISNYSGYKLVVTAGPLHFLHEVSIAFYVFATIGIIVQAMRAKKNISYKYFLALVGVEMAAIIVYVIEKVIDSPLEMINFTYILGEFVLLFLIYRIGRYDVSESIASSVYNLEEYAYMTFDLNLDYLGGSPTLKTFFPDIHNVRVDHPIDPHGDPMIVKAVAWLKTCTITGSKEPLYVDHSGRHLKCTWRTINNGLFGGVSGYLVEIFDDTKQQRYMSLISNYNIQLENEVREKLEHIQAMQDQIIIGLSDIVESRDDSTGGHVKRTSEAVRIFVSQLEKESEDFYRNKKYCENIIKAAPMHDLGKIAVEDMILRKPGRYTEGEFDMMKIHATKGAEIVSKALKGVEDESFLDVAKNMARYHHEKWDGGGYPEGLSGEAIPLEARIMALADVFDALVSRRCYKEKYGYEEAFKIIKDSLGTHFDPDLGRIFLKCRKELEEYYNQFD